MVFKFLFMKNNITYSMRIILEYTQCNVEKVELKNKLIKI